MHKADLGERRVISVDVRERSRWNNPVAFRSRVEDPGITGAGTLHKNLASYPFAVAKRAPQDVHITNIWAKS